MSEKTFHNAAENGDLEKVRLLIESGLDPVPVTSTIELLS